MKIIEGLSITKEQKSDIMKVDMYGYVESYNDNDVQRAQIRALYDACKGMTESYNENLLKEWVSHNKLNECAPIEVFVIRKFKDIVIDRNCTSDIEVIEETNADKVTRGLKNLINFFKEFSFEPNYRFVNTLAFKKAENNNSAMAFVSNYFRLIDSPYSNEVSEKIKSREFKMILDDISCNGAPTKTINKRFKIYFGSAGTGKTTLAQKESDNRCVVCNNSMLPSDLMEDFCFADGKPSFKPSALWNCMTEGKPIVLDEINLLPFDSLRFLQGILDGKSEFTYKGNTVTIKDGFKVIGTMNLSIGGMVYGLPEPLVDRCADMREFTLSAENLLSAIME